MLSYFIVWAVCLLGEIDDCNAGGLFFQSFLPLYFPLHQATKTHGKNRDQKSATGGETRVEKPVGKKDVLSLINYGLHVGF